MLHERLLETISKHVELLNNALKRGINWDDTLELYAILHALQIHAQAVIDYLLHTCSILNITVETPITCITELERRKLLTEKEANTLKRLVRFRNIVVHEYGAIDIDKVRKVINERGYYNVLLTIYKIHEYLRNNKILDP